MSSTTALSRWLAFLLGAFFIATHAATASADVTAAQRAEILDLKKAVRRAGVLFTQKKFDESAKVLTDVQERFEKLTEGAEADLLRQADPLYKSLQKAHALMEFEGVKMKPLKPIGGSSTPPDGAVSFTKQVAPILVGKCGRCHVTNVRGMVDMSNYAALMKGPSAGVIVLPKDDVGSRIIEVITDGDMPRGGLTVAEEELAVLKKWIAEGAKFDGEDPNATLTSLVPNAEPERPATPTAVMATGNESHSFADEIAPIFVENCLGCHGGSAQRPGGRFNMLSFESMLRGGDSGPPILPKQGADSLLIKKLKGTGGGQRMPRGRPPLSDEVIAKIEKWVDEGAPFDGRAVTQSIQIVAAVAKAAKQTHDELSEDRAQLAMANWNLGMPGIPVSEHKTDNFLLMGNVGDSALEEYGIAAEQLAPKIQTMLKIKRPGPFLKGRMTLYFFSKRYDYSEFGKMVQRRDVPLSERGTWRYSVVDAYGALMPPKTDEYSVDSLMGQQMAGAYIASFGEAPVWFTDGVARVVAARLGKDDARVTAWKQSLPSVLSAMRKPDDFLTGKLSPKESEVASYSFADFLLSDSRRFQKLIQTLEQGTAFDAAFPQVYGGSPAEVAGLWIRRAARRR